MENKNGVECVRAEVSEKKRVKSCLRSVVSLFTLLLSGVGIAGCANCGNVSKVENNDAYLQLLCELISMRPVSSDVAAVNKVQERMMQFLSKRGLHCTMERDGERNVLFASTAPGKVQDHILCVHLDVVPAMDESQYTAVIKDGILYGRGSKDCLGHAVAAAKILCNVPAGKKVGCIFTANEEIGGSTTAFMVQKGYRAEKCGYVLDGGNGVIYSQKGIVNYTVTATGRGGHSSTPWLFDNPNIKLINGLQRVLSSWENPSGIEDWRSSLALTVIKSGNVSNRIPDKASAHINVRITRLEDAEKIYKFICEKSGLEVKMRIGCDPFETDPESEVLKRAVAAYNKAFGRNVKPERLCGATDARHLYKMGCPVFITGIDGQEGHGANERIEIASIDKLVSMILELL